MASTATQAPQEGRAIRVRGLVQGVGFRPTVWRLARECALSGSVWNDSEGVMIEAFGEPAGLDLFLRRLRREPPPLARIEAVEWIASSCVPASGGFDISESRGGTVHTAIVPDAASCGECLAELRDSADRRHRYPFTNCTHCGPRLTIVESVPYDRARTSMRCFGLCADCSAEYADPADRRFHAQPTACPVCGPRAWVERLGDGAPIEEHGKDAVAVAADQLRAGAIVAIKGLGGFHLACDAKSETAVALLRTRKQRYAKPFALMARDIETVRQYCDVSDEEATLLVSTAAPIVVLTIRPGGGLAPSIAPGQSTLGFMLPYTPLHHLLLADVDQPLVMTSGNRSDEPQCTDNEQARRELRGIADVALLHDRGIVNRLDDSVVRVMAGAPRLLRRARGYAPAPMALPAGFEQAGPLLAMGGELKSSFCLVDRGQATLSQHLGDLEDAATFDDYRKALDLYLDLFDHEPKAIAVDLHPDYLSSTLGREIAEKARVPLVEVQHHHAHVASCLAENGRPLDAPPVIGVALDGLGYGPDGSMWGGEFLLADYAGFKRLGCFGRAAMPGGAQAIRQPWRSAYAYLDAAIGWANCRRDYPELEAVKALESKPLATLDAMIRESINSPRTSSCGRLFDAVAAVLDVCREQSNYEGQAAIELEAIAAFDADIDAYRISIREGALLELDFAHLWRAIFGDLRRGTPAAVIAARFHRGLAEAIAELAQRCARQARLDTIALSGGSFQNAFLLGAVKRLLEGEGFHLLTQQQVPSNDGGLSLGQAAIAAATLLTPTRTNPCA